MRAVVTRVTEASVTIDGAVHGRIGKGFLVLLGVHTSDTEAEARKIADKICGLRVFEDSAGKMNVNPADAGAARPETAVPLYELVLAECRSRGFHVETGVFGADMQVASINDGPVTILLDTEHL